MLAGEGATLLLTVDCGTTSHEPLAEAKRLGMGVLVLDHHLRRRWSCPRRTGW